MTDFLRVTRNSTSESSRSGVLVVHIVGHMRYAGQWGAGGVHRWGATGGCCGGGVDGGALGG